MRLGKVLGEKEGWERVFGFACFSEKEGAVTFWAAMAFLLYTYWMHEN